MSSKEDQLQMFQVVTGSSEQKARQYLAQSNWNTELAISNWFEQGEVEVNLNPLALPEYQAPPLPVQDVVPPEEEYVGTLPGLYNGMNNTLVPLKAIHVKAKLIDFIGDVEITQRFINQTEKSIEAVFKFEHHEAALTNFEVEVDGKIYKGLCKEKQEVRNMYDDAIASSFGAFMVEKGKKENVYKVSVGNLPPQSECRLTIRYVTELVAEDDYLKFILPITRVRLLAVESKGQDSLSSGLSVTLDISMPSIITEIKSHTHQIDSTVEGKKAQVVLIKDQPQGGREFEIFIKIEHPHEPVSFVEVFSVGEEKMKENEKNEIPVDFGPQPGSFISLQDNFFSLKDFPQPQGGIIGIEDGPSKGPPPHSPLGGTPTLMRSSEVPHALLVTLFPRIITDDDTITEVIFLIDRSGSMAGSRMNQAKNALQLFLRSLPQGTRFNIVGFGSTFEKLFPNSIEFNDSSLQSATNHVLNMASNLGGTNILAPLKDILSTPVHPNYPRQVFCLTDGEVENTQEVLNFVKNNVGSDSRIFTFGIGSEASKMLVRGIAKYGRGKEEFVVSGERIEGKVMKQLKRALMPILKNVTVDWGDLPVTPEFSEDQQNNLTIFDGERLILYTMVRGTEQHGLRNVTISGTTGEKSHKWEVPIDFSGNVFLGSLVHRLAAWTAVRSLESNNAKNNKEKIVRLGQEWGLVTKYTSYIAVEERDFHSLGTSELHKVNVGKQLLKEIFEREEESFSRPSHYNYHADRNAHVDEMDNLLADLSTTSQTRGPSIHMMRHPDKNADLSYQTDDLCSSFSTNSQNKKRTLNRNRHPDKNVDMDCDEVKSEEDNYKVLLQQDYLKSLFQNFGEPEIEAVQNEKEVEKQQNIQQQIQPQQQNPFGNFMESKSRLKSASPPLESFSNQPPLPTGSPSAFGSIQMSQPSVFASPFQSPVFQPSSFPPPASQAAPSFSPPAFQAAPPFPPPASQAAPSFPPPGASSFPSPQPSSFSFSAPTGALSLFDGAAQMAYTRQIPHFGVGASQEVTQPPLVNAHARPLDNFILLQIANGSFVLGDGFLQVVGKNHSKLSLLAAMPQLLTDAKECDALTREAIWVTAIALVVFEMKFSDLKEEWELISEKSRKYLTKELKKINIDIETILLAAKAVL